MHRNKQNGTEGEKLACTYLQQQGLRLIQQNFHSRFGEIDLIMQDQDVIIFVEVRKRKLGIGDALLSITWHKQQKLVKTAKYYLMILGNDVACRFDAVVINANNQVEWLKNIIIL